MDVLISFTDEELELLISGLEWKTSEAVPDDPDLLAAYALRQRLIDRRPPKNDQA